MESHKYSSLYNVVSDRLTPIGSTESLVVLEQFSDPADLEERIAARELRFSLPPQSLLNPTVTLRVLGRKLGIPTMASYTERLLIQAIVNRLQLLHSVKRTVQVRVEYAGYEAHSALVMLCKIASSGALRIALVTPKRMQANVLALASSQNLRMTIVNRAPPLRASAKTRNQEVRSEVLRESTSVRAVGADCTSAPIPLRYQPNRGKSQTARPDPGKTLRSTADSVAVSLRTTSIETGPERHWSTFTWSWLALVAILLLASWSAPGFLGGLPEDSKFSLFSAEPGGNEAEVGGHEAARTTSVWRAKPGAKRPPEVGNNRLEIPSVAIRAERNGEGETDSAVVSHAIPSEDSTCCVEQPSYSIQIASLRFPRFREVLLARAATDASLVAVDASSDKEPLFLLLYGAFSSMDAARAALRRLPAELKREGPFVVPIARLPEAARTQWSSALGS